MNLHLAPNLGPVIISKLKQIEINTVEELQQIGAQQAFIQLYGINNTCCISMLYALEGAVQGIRWHNLDAEQKWELKQFYALCLRR